MGILDDAIREHLELKRAHGAPDDEVRQKEAEAFGPIRQDAAAQVAPEALLPEEHTQLLQADNLDEELHADPAVHLDPSVAHPAAETPAAAEPALQDLEPLEPAAQDPYAVTPGDAAVPDPHDHTHTAGSDPAWAEDTEFFSEAPAQEPAPASQQQEHHHDEPHPALHDHDHIGGEEHAPEPVFRQEAEAPSAPPDAPLEPAPVDDPPVGDPPVEQPAIDEPPPRQSAEPAEDPEDVLEETPEFLQDAPEHDRLWFEQKPPRDFDFGE